MRIQTPVSRDPPRRWEEKKGQKLWYLCYWFFHPIISSWFFCTKLLPPPSCLKIQANIYIMLVSNCHNKLGWKQHKIIISQFSRWEFQYGPHWAKMAKSWCQPDCIHFWRSLGRIYILTHQYWQNSVLVVIELRSPFLY